MAGQEFENMLSRVMKADLAAGTEAFRDALLDRCLAELGSDPSAADNLAENGELPDAALELLAAAGDIGANNLPLGDNGLLED